MIERYRRTTAHELNQARKRAGLPPLMPERLRAMTLSQLVSAAIDAQRMARKCEEAVHRPDRAGVAGGGDGGGRAAG